MRYLKSILFLVLAYFLMMGSRTKEIRLSEGIQPGNLAPEINRQGINLKDNQFTLLQFWTAYDARSRMLNTQVHNVISRLETDTIRLISIALEENEAVFEGVVKADRLNRATQFNDPRGRKSEIFKTYRLKSGFTNFLIDSKGIIVAKNVKPQEITRYIGIHL